MAHPAPKRWWCHLPPPLPADCVALTTLSAKPPAAALDSPAATAGEPARRRSPGRPAPPACRRPPSPGPARHQLGGVGQFGRFEGAVVVGVDAASKYLLQHRARACAPPFSSAFWILPSMLSSSMPIIRLPCSSLRRSRLWCCDGLVDPAVAERRWTTSPPTDCSPQTTVLVGSGLSGLRLELS